MTTVTNRFNSVATSTPLDTGCHRHLLFGMRYGHGINYCYQLVYVWCVRVIFSFQLDRPYPFRRCVSSKDFQGINFNVSRRGLIKLWLDCWCVWIYLCLRLYFTPSHIINVIIYKCMHVFSKLLSRLLLHIFQGWLQNYKKIILKQLLIY